jgi:hypothetical protein
MEDFLLIHSNYTVISILLNTIQIGKNFTQIMLSTSKRPKVRILVYVDADHANDLITRSSNTDDLIMLNNIRIRWVFKHLNDFETSNFGSELVASRISTEPILEFRYMFQSLGGEIRQTTIYVWL